VRNLKVKEHINKGHGTLTVNHFGKIFKDFLKTFGVLGGLLRLHVGAGYAAFFFYVYIPIHCNKQSN
jgi:hypothetical protein